MTRRLFIVGQQGRLICLGVVLAASYMHAQNNTYPWPQSGSVGIGTTSPMAPLDVTGTQTLQNPSGGHYLLNYALGGSFEDPNSGDIILLIPASTGSPVNGSQFEGTIESNRGSAGSWNLNSEWYVSVQSAYTNNTGSILPVSGNQEYASTPILITCVYNGVTYIGFQTPAGNSSSVWSLTGNWSNGQNSQRPVMVTRSSVTNIATLVGYESIGAAISIVSNGNNGNGGAIGANVGIGTTNPASLLSVGASSQFQVNASGAVTSGSIVSSGPVGIGVSPQYTLDVAGQIHASQAVYASGGITFADGSSLSSANTLCGGDYAESVDVTGNRTKYEPGDVLVIDPNTSGKFLKSAEPYSTAVTGIYSTRPGAVGRRQSTPKSDAEVPMAMIGIVPTKVSAENGPIHRGDLLVTSSTIGYAMKGTDRGRLTGAVIGKALDSLESGKGVIEVVVTLQ